MAFNRVKDRNAVCKVPRKDADRFYETLVYRMMSLSASLESAVYHVRDELLGTDIRDVKDELELVMRYFDRFKDRVVMATPCDEDFVEDFFLRVSHYINKRINSFLLNMRRSASECDDAVIDAVCWCDISLSHIVFLVDFYRVQIRKLGYGTMYPSHIDDALEMLSMSEKHLNKLRLMLHEDDFEYSNRSKEAFFRLLSDLTDTNVIERAIKWANKQNQ